MPKTGAKKNLAERLRPILQRYNEILPELIAASPDTFFMVNYWTPLKLYCLAAYLHSCYIPIISKNPTIQKQIGENFYFVDLLSSSGINLVCDQKNCISESQKCAACKSDRKSYIVGSPLIAATASPPFKAMYFVDLDLNNLETLHRRLTILKQKGMCQSEFIFKNQDCNLAVDEIITDIKRRGNFHFLVFIDNIGLNAHWETVNKLIDTHFCDLIINFPTSSVKRNINNRESVERFLGLSGEEPTPIYPLGYYMGKLRDKHRTVETISVNTRKGYHYDIIIVTKEGASFSGVIQHIKENTEINSAKEAQIAFSILNGRQRTLLGYSTEEQSNSE